MPNMAFERDAPKAARPSTLLLCATNMKLRATDYDILSYLLKTKALSYDKAIEWAYSKYTNDGVDQFIEKLLAMHSAAAE